MSSTLSSVHTTPIPDLAYDSYRSLSLRDRDQAFLRRQLPESGSESGATHHPQYHPPNGTSYFHEDFPTMSDSPQMYQSNSQQPSEVGFMLSPPDSETVPTTVLRARPMGSRPSNRIITTPANETVVKRRPSSFFVASGNAYNLDQYQGESLAFWILLGLLAVLVIGNSILTFIVFGVVRVGTGIESIEFLPNVLKFYGNTDLGEIYKRDGILEGFEDEPMEIWGEEGGEVNFRVREGTQPTLAVEKSAINISNVEEFRVVDKSGKEVFSTNTPTLGLPRGVQKLDVRVAKVNRVTSPVNASLQLVSTTFTYLKGSEGTHLEAKQILFKADQDIFLKSVNGNIVVTGRGREGIHLNVHDLPLVRETGVTRKSHTYTTHGKKEPQYQLCICMPTGKLYKVEIPLNNLSLPSKQRVGCHTPRHLPC